MRSRCQECAQPMSRSCEADVETNPKSISIQLRSRCQEGNHRPSVACTDEHGWWKYTQTHWRQMETNRQICSYQSLHWLLGFFLVLHRNIDLTIKRASRSNVRPGFRKVFEYVSVLMILNSFLNIIHRLPPLPPTPPGVERARWPNIWTDVSIFNVPNLVWHWNGKRV